MPEFKVGDRIKVVRCIKWPGDESWQPIRDAQKPDRQTRVFTVLEVVSRIRVSDPWDPASKHHPWLELDYFQIEHE